MKKYTIDLTQPEDKIWDQINAVAKDINKKSLWRRIVSWF